MPMISSGIAHYRLSVNRTTIGNAIRRRVGRCQKCQRRRQRNRDRGADDAHRQSIEQRAQPGAPAGKIARRQFARDLHDRRPPSANRAGSNSPVNKTRAERRLRAHPRANRRRERLRDRHRGLHQNATLARRALRSLQLGDIEVEYLWGSYAARHIRRPRPARNPRRESS